MGFSFNPVIKSYTFYVSLTFMDTFLRENLNFRSISTEIDNQKRLVSTADKEVTPPPPRGEIIDTKDTKDLPKCL